MAIDIPTRDKLVSDYERDYKIRRSGALVGEGTLPGTDARICADMLLPLYAEASNLGDEAELENLSGDRLEQEAADLGLPTRLPAVGASGHVEVTTATGGATILSGQALTNQTTGLRYQCIATGLYTTGDQVPVAGVDTGPQTDVAAGVVMTWSSPPSGLSPSCTVVEQEDGTGLSGGREEETDAGIRLRIIAAESDPAAAGNDAAYRAEAFKTPGLSIGGVFTYPCVQGPGSTSLCFLLQPATAGDSRIPNSAQKSLVAAYLGDKFPVDDTVLIADVVAEPIDVYLQVRWGRTAVGWADASPWPVYDATDKFVIANAPAPTATTFTVSTTMASPTQPGVGQTLAFYDAENRKFVAKRILTVTGTNPWDIVVDTTLNASDTSYVPADGDIVSPWSESLDDIVEIMLADFDALGPGEQSSALNDTARQRRNPPVGTDFPSAFTGLSSKPASAEYVKVSEPTLPSEPSVGALGTDSNLLTIGDIGVYPI